MVRDRARAEARGRLAETAALTLLRLKGYRLLARRFKCPAGEVDLIMRKRDVTAFIEVKSRDTHDAAVQSLTDYQSRRIAAAASHWMAQDAEANKGPCRFDIVAVNSRLIPKHVENAFEGAW
jgi:putative endonuclease